MCDALMTQKSHDLKITHSVSSPKDKVGETLRSLDSSLDYIQPQSKHLKKKLVRSF